MAKKRNGRYEKDCTNKVIIARLKVRRNQFYTIEELMSLTQIGRAGIFNAFRSMQMGDRWLLRFKFDDVEPTKVVGVALFIDRSDVMRDTIYNPACWPVPKSLQTRAV